MLAPPREGDSAPDISCWLLLLYYDHKWSLGKHGIRAFSSVKFFLCGRIFILIEVYLKREKYIYLYIYRKREREREKVASSVWGYVFSPLRTSHGFEDMLHSPGLPTVQHHNSNNTPLTTSKLQVNPVYMSICVCVRVFVCVWKGEYVSLLCLPVFSMTSLEPKIQTCVISTYYWLWLWVLTV